MPRSDSTTARGRNAEQIAAKFLQQKGFIIKTFNWRTRWCEIDIVATKSEVVYFVEVKYRQSDTWGNGLDYVTNKKLQQMMFAAEFWIARCAWQGDYILSAVAVSGRQPRVTDWIENLTR